jgi:hypothetical protein
VRWRSQDSKASGSEFNPETKCRESFVIAETVDLDKSRVYAKENALIQEVKAQLARGRKCQVFAVYTNKHDVIERLEGLFRNEGIRPGVLRASVATHKREAWYREQLRRGIDVAICHPKIVETGLDLLDFPTILFHETGYSLHTLRQSSRRSWRIGQRRPVEVKFFAYSGTMQEVCLRLMGKKLLVALATEHTLASQKRNLLVFCASSRAHRCSSLSRPRKRRVAMGNTIPAQGHRGAVLYYASPQHRQQTAAGLLALPLIATRQPALPIQRGTHSEACVCSQHPQRSGGPAPAKVHASVSRIRVNLLRKELEAAVAYSAASWRELR